MMNKDRLVNDYLDRLEAAARSLPAGRRRELVEEVREHIETDLAREGRQDEAVVRNVLERLGPPEAIVAAELDAGHSGPSETILALGRVDRSLGVGEVLAVLLLTVGVVVAPIIGPAVGLVLVWASGHWSRRTKLVITAVAVILLVVPVVLLLQASSSVVSTS
jgi:HAAS domain-containing protein